MDERILARAVRAWRQGYLWLNRKSLGIEAEKPEKDETMDAVLDEEGINFSVDPKEYLRWERAIRTRALRAIQAEGLGKRMQGTRMSGRKTG